jgi:uncharacterized membrane-anchored protein YitT (DUF2179 family)
MDVRQTAFRLLEPHPHPPYAAGRCAQGLFASSMIAALGLALMGSAGLVASGTAGVAFVLHYLTGVQLRSLSTPS